MKKLVDVVKGDVNTALRVGKDLIKGSAVGVFRGAYTPFLLYTGINQTRNDSQRDLPVLNELSREAAQIVSAVLIQAYLASGMIHYGKGKEYFGALALTNVINYGVNAYKRSRN